MLLAHSYLYYHAVEFDAGSAERQTVIPEVDPCPTPRDSLIAGSTTQERQMSVPSTCDMEAIHFKLLMTCFWPFFSFHRIS